MLYRDFQDQKRSLLGFGAMRLPTLADGSVVPAGMGIGNVPAIVKDYLTNGGSVMTVEPHLAIFDGHPFSNFTRCKATMIDGQFVFDELGK